MSTEALSTIAIAEKQRHLYLLQKVKENKSLSPKEIQELKDYESKGQKDKKPVKKISSDKNFAALAAELKSVAAIDSQLEEHFELEKYPRVKQALEEAIGNRVRDIIQEQFEAAAKKDYRNVTLKQLIELTGRRRRTIYDWISKGLPRNSDGSFYLPNFITWFEKYTIEKLPAKVISKINPLQALKAERLELDLKRARNELLARDEVMAGQLARHQNLINSLSHKAEELAMLCNGLPQEKIAAELNSFFDELLSRQCQVPEQLRLSEIQENKFKELLRSLEIEEK